MSDLASQLLATALGGLLALIGGVAAAYSAAAITRRHSRESLAAALAGEIGAIILLVERREYLKGLDELIAHVERTGQPAAFHFRMRNNYFRVYETNIDKIGLLPPELAEGIVRFYANCYAFLEDVADFAEGRNDPHVMSESLWRLKEMRGLLTDSIPLAEQCRDLARYIAGRPVIGDPSMAGVPRIAA